VIFRYYLSCSVQNSNPIGEPHAAYRDLRSDDDRFEQTPSPFPFPSLQGTPEDQAACRPDAIKFCKPYLDDQFRVLECLQANRQQISPACQAVLTKYGQ